MNNCFLPLLGVISQIHPSQKHEQQLEHLKLNLDSVDWISSCSTSRHLILFSTYFQDTSLCCTETTVSMEQNQRGLVDFFSLR
ncbi:hypothetical protein Y1Q_0019886 [Alligator mississippiensis]|uniref:Uncharacterized protein n=1 Tax=Alligator mississippiensis TaxID=8496 RepID=A0A151PGD0_ALLMI|nr:hypothetical protein Y1Q_0019886 [Alligator mississippiensis]